MDTKTVTVTNVTAALPSVKRVWWKDSSGRTCGALLAATCEGVVTVGTVQTLTFGKVNGNRRIVAVA